MILTSIFYCGLAVVEPLASVCGENNINKRCNIKYLNPLNIIRIILREVATLCLNPLMKL